MKKEVNENEVAIKVGYTYRFAGYEWLPFKVQAEKALLLSKYVLEERAYHSKFEDITWKDSDIRNYLNGEFYNQFNEKDKARIVETQVANNCNPRSWYCFVKGRDDTNDKIFLLSVGEVDDNWGIFFDRYREAAAMNMAGDDSWWWLRNSPSDSGNASCITTDGLIDPNSSHMDNIHGGVRPALWVSLETCYECDTYDSGNLSDAINAINNDGENVKVCSSCLDTEYLLCEDCNKYNHVSRIIDITDADGGHAQVCTDCLDNDNYRECVGCGNICHVDENEDFSGIQGFLCFYCAENIESA